MKYQPPQAPIPQSKRKGLNEKVLSLIDSGNAAEFGITQEDIFNAYTGDGGLHGLERKDFDNYRAYSEAKKEIENGQFFTPPALCDFVVPDSAITISMCIITGSRIHNTCFRWKQHQRPAARF